MRLEAELKGALDKSGWLGLPGAVPRERAEAARRVVNNALGKLDAVGADLSQPGSVRFEASQPALLALLDGTRLAAMLEELLGGKLAAPSRAEVSLRFPAPPGAAAEPGARRRADALLAAVLLDDCPEAGRGNLVLSNDRCSWEFAGKAGDAVLIRGADYSDGANPSPHVRYLALFRPEKAK